MNRKLHNTILAFSVSGVMLFLGLVVAQPASLQPAGQGLPDAPLANLTVPHARHDGLADAAIAARIESRARGFEDEVARAETTGEALAMTAGFIAATATEAALVAALSELRQDHAEAEAADGLHDAPRERSAPRRRSGKTRDVIAVPYFSFARGSRGGSRS